MAKTFITDDFLLQTKTAQRLYHDYAAAMPIFDYHCHLPPEEIAADKGESERDQLHGFSGAEQVAGRQP